MIEVHFLSEVNVGDCCSYSVEVHTVNDAQIRSVVVVAAVISYSVNEHCVR